MDSSKRLSRPPLARMLRIHELLQTKDRASCRTFALELEVSAKTVQRDIDFMRDQLGLPIDYDVSAHGFYYTRKVVQFPTMKISEGELVALSVARKALAQYRGTPFEALGMLELRWSALRRSLLMLVPLVRYIMCNARSTVLMQCAAQSGGRDRARYLRRARRDARAVATTRIGWSAPAGEMLQGGLARLETRPEAAQRHFQAAEDGFARAGMKMHAAAARHARGQVQGGEAGAALCAEALAVFAGEGVQVPGKMLRVFGV